MEVKVKVNYFLDTVAYFDITEHLEITSHIFKNIKFMKTDGNLE